MTRTTNALVLMLTLGGCAADPGAESGNDKEGFDFTSPVPELEGAPARELVLDESNFVDLRTEQEMKGSLDPERHYARWFRLYENEVASAEAYGESMVLHSSFEWDWSFFDYLGVAFDYLPEYEYSATQRLFHRASDADEWTLLTELYDGRLETMRVPLRHAGEYLVVITALGAAYEADATFAHVMKLSTEPAELAPPRDIAVTIRTQREWLPAAGVRVAIALQEAVTDADGRAVLRSVEPGFWAVKLGPNGFLRGDVSRIDILNRPGALGTIDMLIDDEQYACLQAGGQPDRFFGGCKGASAAQ